MSISRNDSQGDRQVNLRSTSDTLNIHTSNVCIHTCPSCGDDVPHGRYMLGYKVCMSCGDIEAREERASWTVVPMPKSNYILVTDHALLKGLNSSHRGNR